MFLRKTTTPIKSQLLQNRQRHQAQDFDAPGTLVSTSMNANVITIVCQGSEGLCFTIHDKELTTYSRTGAPETYNVTSVTHVSGKGDNTEYIIGVE